MHTQGKWTVKNGAYIGQYVIKEFDDKVNDLSLRKKPLLWDENDANKALISAAPDLLEACKQSLYFILNIPPEVRANLLEGGTMEFEKLEQAIAQAESVET